MARPKKMRALASSSKSLSLFLGATVLFGVLLAVATHFQYLNFFRAPPVRIRRRKQNCHNISDTSNDTGSPPTGTTNAYSPPTGTGENTQTQGLRQQQLRQQLPPNVCMFVLIRWEDYGWGDAYHREAAAWNTRFTLQGLKDQTVLGAVPVMVGNASLSDEQSTMLSEMGGHAPQGDKEALTLLLELVEHNKLCEWVVQARVDADDLLTDKFVSMVLHNLLHEVESAGTYTKRPVSDNDVYCFHQARLSQLYIFEKDRKLVGCHIRKLPYRHLAPSTGLTMVIKRPFFVDGIKGNIHQYPITALHHGDYICTDPPLNARSVVPFPPDSGTLSVVSILSGHFPWFETRLLKPCDVGELKRYYDPYAVELLLKARLPSLPFLDACLSNQYVRGLISRTHTKFDQRNCTELHGMWQNEQTKTDLAVLSWPQLGPYYPKELA